MDNRQLAYIYPSHGLGDGLIFLTIAHNLCLNGYEVHVFHNKLVELRDWFPNFQIHPLEDLSSVIPKLSTVEYIIINLNDSPFNKGLRDWCSNNIPDKTYIFAPSSRKAKVAVKKPFVFVDRSRPIVSSLVDFCKITLHLEKIEKSNGISPPKSLGLVHKKFDKRIVIHPTSSEPRKNWPLRHFFTIYHELSKMGYSPYFALSKQELEMPQWNAISHFSHIKSSHLTEVASLIYESCFFIGNDSGLGHLASCLQIPTLSIFNCPRKQVIWLPDWASAESIAPYKWLPNFKFFRIRGRIGLAFIHPKMILKRIKNKLTA